MAENHTLRGLVRSLAGFIGDGAGGLLPKLGWDITDFNAFISKSETDTAWESHQRRKKSLPGEASSSGSQLQGQKRPPEEDSVASRKKIRSDEPEHDQPNGYPLPFLTHPISAAYSPNTAPRNRNGIFPDPMRGADPSPLYMHQSSSTTTSSPYNTVSSSTIEPYQAPFISNVNMTMESPISYDTSSSRSAPSQQRGGGSNTTTNTEELETDDDPNKHEAYKLIQYAQIFFLSNSMRCDPLNGTQVSS